MARTERTARIAASVARGAGSEALPDVLSELAPAGLGSLLLEVFRRRSARVPVREVSTGAGRALFRPSAADGRLFHRFDAAALDAAAGFECLDVSPVAPFGAVAALAGIDQNNVLTALRRAEALSDPTVALALAAAERRRRRGDRTATATRLCSSARLVRMQSLVDAPKELTPHFRLFALATAGRDVGEHRFETDALADHAIVWLRLARRLRADGFRIGEAVVEISDLEAVAALCAAHGVEVSEVRAVAAAHRIGAAAELLARRGVELPAGVADPRRDLGPLHARLPTAAALRLDRVRERIFPAIEGAFPGTPVRLDLSRLEGLGYYPGLALRISIATPVGMLPVVDGGFTSWTQSLLADRKERLLASAIGTEAVCKLCPPAAPAPGGDGPRP